MFAAETPVIELTSRLGRVGSIQMWDCWKSRESLDSAKWWVAKVASLSYGNEEASNPGALVQRILERGHLSCLEFVPVENCSDFASLPPNSLRDWDNLEDLTYIDDANEEWSQCPKIERRNMGACWAFLVEAPIFVARQWMRHRSFAYLEMSRRYVKGAKVPLTFYGTEYGPAAVAAQTAARIYDMLIEAGQPPELARRVLPVGMMTRFWAAGFADDWREFVRLRSDSHAQPEIRVFSDKIAELIE